MSDLTAADVLLYQLSKQACETRYLLLPLAHDVEITTFGDGGRDVTFKALGGDYLVVAEDEDGNWQPVDVHPASQDLDDVYEPHPNPS